MVQSDWLVLGIKGSRLFISRSVLPETCENCPPYVYSMGMAIISGWLLYTTSKCLDHSVAISFAKIIMRRNFAGM